MNMFCFVIDKVRPNVRRFILLSYYHANVNPLLSYGIDLLDKNNQNYFVQAVIHAKAYLKNSESYN